MKTFIRNDAKNVRRGRIVASIIAVTAMLAGCSSASDAQATYSENYGDDFAAGAEADFAAPEPAADSRADGEERSEIRSTRSVIITGDMYITVEDPIVAADRASGLVKNAGGRIDARNETAPHERSGGSAWLTMRIPADRLDSVVEGLRKLGTVDEFSTNSYDVTNEVTDLDAKISTLRASTARVEALLADAKGIPEILSLERELDDRQSELESLEARQRGLADQVSMSTINLSLTTEPVEIIIEDEDDDSPKSFLEGLADGWDGLVGFLSAFAIVFGVMLPWLALFAAIGAAIYGIYRARRSSREANATAAATPPPPPAPATKK